MLIAAKHEEVNPVQGWIVQCQCTAAGPPRPRRLRQLCFVLFSCGPLVCLVTNKPFCTLAVQEMHPSVLDFTNIADNCFMVGCPCTVACVFSTICSPPPLLLLFLNAWQSHPLPVLTASWHRNQPTLRRSLCLPAARRPAAHGGNHSGLPVLPHQQPHRPHLPVDVQAGAGAAAPHLCPGQLLDGERQLTEVVKNTVAGCMQVASKCPDLMLFWLHSLCRSWQC